jgi:hypothetical protein
VKLKRTDAPKIQTRLDRLRLGHKGNVSWSLPYYERGVPERSMLRCILHADWDDLGDDEAERRLSRYFAMSQSDPTLDHDIELGARDFAEAIRLHCAEIAEAEQRRAKIIDMLAVASPFTETYWQDQLEQIEDELVRLVA